MILFFIVLVTVALFLMVMRFVQPEFIYILRRGLVTVRSNKAFLDVSAGRVSKDVLFWRLLTHDARDETRAHDPAYILNERVIRIRELYRLLDLRRDLPAKVRKEQRPQVCIVELGGLLSNLGRRVEADVEVNNPVVNASALLRYIGDTVRSSHDEKPFEQSDNIDDWYVENPITIEQVIELMLASVVGLAHRKQAAMAVKKARRKEPLDHWLEIKTLEKRLRQFVRSELKKKYVTDDLMHKQIQVHLGGQVFSEVLRNMERSRRQNPGVAYDFFDFLYFGQLEAVMFKEWELFGGVFPEKRWLKEKLEKIIQVRNEEAHTRETNEREQMLVIGYCSEIANRIANFKAGDV